MFYFLTFENDLKELKICFHALLQNVFPFNYLIIFTCSEKREEKTNLIYRKVKQINVTLLTLLKGLLAE